MQLKKCNYDEVSSPLFYYLCCDRKSRAACAQNFAPWQQATIEIMLAIFLTIACLRYIYSGVILHAHRARGESQSTQRHRRGPNNILPFLQRTTPIACSLSKGWTRHDLHILVTAPFCCDRKSWAACAQSFAPWQQATIESMLAISLTIACSHYIYSGVILHAHPARGESHNQRNATGEVATLDSRGFQTTACRPNPAFEVISSGRIDILSLMKKW